MQKYLIVASLLATFATPAAAQKIIQIVPTQTPTRPQPQQVSPQRDWDELQREYARRQPTNEMRTYAQRLERAMLEAGMDTRVSALGEGTGWNDPPFPALRFHGYFSRPTVFQFLKDGTLLRTAKNLGFRAVAFNSKYPSDHYVVDLSGADLPTCTGKGSVGDGLYFCW